MTKLASLEQFYANYKHPRFDETKWDREIKWVEHKRKRADGTTKIIRKPEYIFHPLCFWCQKRLPKNIEKRVCKTFCGKHCHGDFMANSYPSWMTGRIGPPPQQGLQTAYGYWYITAPNRYRQMFRKKSNNGQEEIVERQRVEYPALSFPRGIDFSLDWDMVLLWGAPNYLLEHKVT